MGVRREQRECDRHARAAFRPVLGHCRAAVLFRDRFYNVKPKPEPPAAGAGGIALVKPLKDARQLLGRKARAGVADAKLKLALTHLSIPPNFTAGGRKGG